MVIALETKPEKKTTYCRSKADDFFKTFPVEKVQAYKDYWESVAPQTDGDRFRRYLFAYCSVHTSRQLSRVQKQLKTMKSGLTTKNFTR